MTESNDRDDGKYSPIHHGDAQALRITNEAPELLRRLIALAGHSAPEDRSLNAR